LDGKGAGVALIGCVVAFDAGAAEFEAVPDFAAAELSAGVLGSGNDEKEGKGVGGVVIWLLFF
jgi:hypothetical protein